MHKPGEVGSSIIAENGKAFHLAVALHERKAWFKAYAEGDAYDPTKSYFVKRIEQKYFDRERLAFDIFSQAGGHPGLVMP